MSKFKVGDRVYVEKCEEYDGFVSTTGTVIGKDGSYYRVKMDWYGNSTISNEKYQSDPNQWFYLSERYLRKLAKLEELLLERE